MSKRETFIKMIIEICKEDGYNYKILSDGWVIGIYKKKEKLKFIYRYSFPINPDSSAKICSDKSITTEVLNIADIPNIQHKAFDTKKNVNESKGNWGQMIRFFNENNNKIVVKPNNGSSGTGVFLAKSLYDLENILYNKLRRRPVICLSPYYKLKNEFRVVVFKDNYEVVYKKIRPNIIGDGNSTIRELIFLKYKKIPINFQRNIEEDNYSLNSILKKNLELKLNWKHNLSSGSKVDLNINEGLKKEVINLAIKAAKSIGMVLCSVDIVQMSNNELKVIEVNSGVMLVNFAMNGENEKQISKNIYRKVIKSMIFN